MKQYFTFLLACSLLSTMALAEIQVQDHWVRASTGSNTAAYMKLINTSDSDVSLINVSSLVSASAELHEIVDVEGRKQMQEISAIHIPAKGNISLKPGGTHIMLMALQAPLTEGQKDVPLTLEFSHGEKVQLTAPVKAQ
ncbi:MAG: copper chaperone PCu(A)C [Alphaproteobacteria bacterium]|nr:copper chaperone PCu(A)C [Alphaproteobacteria bacterium]